MTSRESRRARRRPVVPHRVHGYNWVNYGAQAMDAVSGIWYPKRLMVPQRGGLVSRNWADGTRDAVDPIDAHQSPPTQLAVPDPLYRLVSATTRGVITIDEDERDDAVDDGFTWSVLGYGYPDGDEEDDLTRLYRSINSGNSNHLHTIDAAEHAAALLAGFTEETDSIYVFSTAAPGRKPIYRFYNSGTATHRFTDTLLDQDRLGSAWALEGLKFYILRGPERTRD